MSSPENPHAAHRVHASGGHLHVIDQPGAEPAIVLMHGFPDDRLIYRKLIPHLAPPGAAPSPSSATVAPAVPTAAPTDSTTPS